MSVVIACGAECGIAATGIATGTAQDRHWSALSGAPAIDAVTFRSGAKSYKFVAAATAPYLTRTCAASQSVLYARFYFRLTDATPTSDTYLLYANVVTGSSPQLIVTTGGVLQAGWGASTQNGPTLSDNTWYGVEMELDAHANPNVLRWRTWDAGTGWTSRTDVSLAQAADTFANVNLGIVAGPSSGTTVNLDDILIGEGTTAGADYSTSTSKGGKVLRYRPTADGTHSSFRTWDMAYNANAGIASSATDVYTYVDDDDQTSVADFIAQMVAQGSGGSLPTIRAVGAIASGTTTIAPGLPTGTIAGDLLLMFLENQGTGESAPTASGWTQLLTQVTADDGGAGNTDTRLTVLYRIAASGSDATTTNDPGDHIVGRIIGITRGTFDGTTPFHQSTSSKEDTADTSASLPTVTTTINNCLIIGAIAHGNDPASAGTANYSSWTNAALGSVTERIDNTRTDGNGGGLGVYSGTLATAGAVGNTTATLAVASYKAMATIAIAPHPSSADVNVEVTFADEGTEASPRVVAVTSTHHSSGTTANEMNLRVSDDGTNWTNVWGNWGATGYDTSDATAWHLHKVLASPPSGGSWSQSKVNGMRAQWGHGDTVATVPYLDSISLEVEWTESTGYTGTGALTGQVITASGTGASGASGTGAPSTRPLTASGTGTQTFIGTGALATAPLTASGTGASGAVGTGTPATQPLTASGTGAESFVATGALTTQPLTVSGTGAETIAGTGSPALAPLTASGTGAAGAAGTGALATQPVAAAGTGAETFTGTGAPALRPLTASGTGAAGAAGTGAATTQPVAAAGTGAETFTGSGTPALRPLTTAGTGAAGASGTGSLTGQPLTAAGTGAESMAGTGALTIGPLQASGSGTATVAGAVTGDGALATQPLTAVGTGSAGAIGTGAAATQPLTASGTGALAFAGTGALATQPASAAGTGAAGASGAGSLALVAPTLDGTGLVILSGSGAATLAPVTASGVGALAIIGSGALSLPPIAMDGAGGMFEVTAGWSSASISSPGTTVAVAGPGAGASVTTPGTTASVALPGATASTTSPATEAEIR